MPSPLLLSPPLLFTYYLLTLTILDSVRVADKKNVEDFVSPVIYKGQESAEIDVAFLQVDGTVTVDLAESGTHCFESSPVILV